MDRLGGGPLCCCWGLVLLWAVAGGRAGEAGGSRAGGGVSARSLRVGVGGVLRGCLAAGGAVPSRLQSGRRASCRGEGRP